MRQKSTVKKTAIVCRLEKIDKKIKIKYILINSLKKLKKTGTMHAF